MTAFSILVASAKSVGGQGLFTIRIYSYVHINISAAIKRLIGHCKTLGQRDGDGESFNCAP